MTDSPGPPAILSEGRRASAFHLPASDGTRLRLSDLRGGKVVLFFYPKDLTPGCTLEAGEFRDHVAGFTNAGALVLGISPDSLASHEKFVNKHGLNYRLLVDEDHKIAAKYGVWVEKSMYGRKFMGVQRSTFLIGADGKILRVWPKVRPKGHAAEVLAAID